jgi:hypothetical protein
MTKILGISGSLRGGSLNTMLLKSAAQLVPEGTHLEIGSIRGIPLYDGDLESSSGIPEAAQKLKAQIMEVLARTRNVSFDDRFSDFSDCRRRSHECPLRWPREGRSHDGQGRQYY